MVRSPIAETHRAPSFLLGSPAGELALRVCGTSRDGQVVRVKSQKCLVGSAPNSTLRLRSAGIRPLHCLILRGLDGVVARSCSCDTRLNGRSFTDARLTAGDRLAFGPIEFEVLADTFEQLTVPLVQPIPTVPREMAARLEARGKLLTSQIRATRERGVGRAKRLIGELRSSRRQIAEWEARAGQLEESLLQRQADLEARRDELEEIRSVQSAELAEEAARLSEESERLAQERVELGRRQTNWEDSQQHTLAFSNEERERVAAEQVRLFRLEAELDARSVELKQVQSAREAVLSTQAARLSEETARLAHEREELDLHRAAWQNTQQEARACSQAEQESLAAEHSRLAQLAAEFEARQAEFEQVHAKRESELATQAECLAEESARLARERQQLDGQRLAWDEAQRQVFDNGAKEHAGLAAEQARQAQVSAELEARRAAFEQTLATQESQWAANAAHLAEESARLAHEREQLDVERAAWRQTQRESQTSALAQQEHLAAEQARLACVSAKLDARGVELEQRQAELEQVRTISTPLPGEPASNEASGPEDGRFQTLVLGKGQLKLVAEQARRAHAEIEAQEQRLALEQQRERRQSELEQQSRELIEESKRLAQEHREIAALRAQLQAEREQQECDLQRRSEHLLEDAHRLVHDREEFDRARVEWSHVHPDHDARAQAEHDAQTRQLAQFNEQQDQFERIRHEWEVTCRRTEAELAARTHEIIEEGKRLARLRDELEAQSAESTFQACDKGHQLAVDREDASAIELVNSVQVEPSDALVESTADMLAQLGQSGLWREESADESPRPSNSDTMPIARYEDPPEAPAESFVVRPDSEPEDDSIENYMARLLQRVRGDEAGPAPQVVAIPTTPTAVLPKDEEVADATSDLPKSESEPNLEAQSFIPRSQAPEKAVSLAAMRDIANQSARSAIDKSRKNRGQSKATGKFLLSFTALAAGVGLILANPGLGSPLFLAGLACGAASIYCVLRGVRLRSNRRQKMPARTNAEPVSGSEVAKKKP